MHRAGEAGDGMPGTAPPPPACHTEGEPTARAPAFADRGRSCSFGWDPVRLAEALQRGCRGCSRLRRGADIRSGVVAADKPVRRVKARSRPAGGVA